MNHDEHEGHEKKRTYSACASATCFQGGTPCRRRLFLPKPNVGFNGVAAFVLLVVAKIYTVCSTVNCDTMVRSFFRDPYMYSL